MNSVDVRRVSRSERELDTHEGKNKNKHFSCTTNAIAVNAPTITTLLKGTCKRYIRYMNTQPARSGGIHQQRANLFLNIYQTLGGGVDV